QVQVRIINLLGERRDAESIEAIGALVFSADKQVGEAAVAALGKIGGAGARKILAQARAKGDADLKFAASDAYLRCAEDLAFEGENEQAAAIYKELAAQNEVAIFRSAAIKGLADIGGSGAVRLVIAALRDQNRTVRITAAGCVRTMEGEGVTGLFAAELAGMPPAEQVLLIGALADRGDAAGLPAIMTAVDSKDPAIRDAALQAVGKLGDASSVEFLADVASGDSSSEDKAAALESLTILRGDGVDEAIIRSMQKSQAAVRLRLIEVLSDRLATGAIDALIAETSSSDSGVRRAAYKALARLADEKDLPSLVGLLVEIADDSGRRDAERAVIAVSRKVTDEDKQADVVLAALSAQKNVPVKCSLLRVLGGIANSKSLDTLAVASQHSDATVRDTAVRTLSKWPNASATEVLLVIYGETEDPIHRLLAVRGFARLLSLPAESRPVEKTLQMCNRAMAEARTTDERKLVLSGLGHVGDPKTLAMIEPFLQNEAVGAEAAMATMKVADAIGQRHPEKARTAVNKLLIVLKNPTLREQAEAVIRQIDEAQEQPKDE
ncbi:MAG: HEAT repeat domain-containing protein, partial [Planctomycetota bacterium]